MALTLAIPLSGLDIYQFHCVHRILCRSDISPSEQPISPSTRSDSSGISSLTTVTDIATPSLSPISSSDTPSEDNNNNNAKSDYRLRVRYSTPAKMASHLLVADLCGKESFHQRIILPSVSQTRQPIAKPPCRQSKLQESCVNKHLSVVYGKRDILNLEANLRAPFWQIRTPVVPKNNIAYYMENRSVYHRLGEFGHTAEYPMTHCKNCNFAEPSPFIFHGLRW